ncbi:MAG: response regulator transcription factor [Candidatus Blackburnbacteria bacterium]|nr:response regulator transcription factor [Candidatus Blackburnbacteria bacterium]
MVSKLLLVEDDRDLQDSLKELFTAEGFFVKTASDGVEALKNINKGEFDLLILDLGLPVMSGESVLTEVRKKYPELPVIVLTARDTTSDVIRGLNLGADDYVTKPFVVDELIARVKAKLRSHQTGEQKMKVGDLELDPTTFEAKRGGKRINLTPQEFKLLQYLMANRGRVLTRDAILNRVWFYSPEVETRVVDVYIGYLRKKVDRGHRRKLLSSVRGFGYILKEKE